MSAPEQVQEQEIREFDPISLGIIWSRLIGIADDMWTTVLRTAVSTIIGAAQDFGCEILDARGNSVAHSNRSMPVFNIVMPAVTRAVLKRYPVESMHEGDVYITNDPWLCAGHLDDIATITPIFFNGRVVAFGVTIAHTSSIGGTLTSRTVRDIYEEGLRIPVLKLYDKGQRNETAWAFIQENVRTPEMVLTDIEAQLTANDLGVRRVVALLREYDLPDLSSVAATIQTHSERAMREAIRALPDGVYESEVTADGLENPIRLQCRVTVAGDEIAVDYAGSDPESPNGGINCTLTYTQAHTVYPLKCLLSPNVPANEGTFRPFTIQAPQGSILNCNPPVSVGSRTRTGWHIHALLFSALEPVLPDRVQAGNGLMHSVHVYGQERDGHFFNAHFFVAGGRGASRGRDGLGRNCFPSSARNVPVEVFEARVPVVVHSRNLRPDSAGTGRWRGAFGHRIEFRTLPGYERPLSFFLNPDRLKFPPKGLAGGEDGPLTEIALNGRRLSPEEIGSGQLSLRTPEDRLELAVPGGAGYGHVADRDAGMIEADRTAGLVRGDYSQPRND
jgi:N-methylhydantoinase B/oxoprolinase/acetone carboxylase alpha subunit